MRKTSQSWALLPLVGAALSVSLGVHAAQLPAWALGAGSFLAAPAAWVQAAVPPASPAPSPLPTPAPAAASPAPVSIPGPTPAPPVADAWAELPAGEPPAGAGKVVEKHYGQKPGGAFLPCGPATIRNNTKLYPQAELAAAAAAGLPFVIEKDSPDPQVLILHTHATECYRTHTGLWYAPGDTARSTDPTIGVCAVGQVMTDVLNGAGVNTVHDTTLNDYPSYNASYGNSRAVAQRWLAQYPTIKVILDVHRDAIEADGVRFAPVADVGGRQAAQVMIISGADNGGTVQLPRCMQNLGFAAAWQAKMETDWPGLTRPVLFSHRFYNQDLSTGALLLEVGGHGTSLDQALYAGSLAARSLAAVLTGAGG